MFIELISSKNKAKNVHKSCGNISKKVFVKDFTSYNKMLNEKNFLNNFFVICIMNELNILNIIKDCFQHKIQNIILRSFFTYQAIYFY